MSTKLIIAIRDVLAPRHYLLLLISLISLTVVAPLVDHDFWTRAIVSIFLLLSLLTASLAVNRAGHRTFLSFFLVFLLSIMWALAFSYNASPFNTAYFQVASFAVTLLFFINAGSVMWQDIFSGAPTANRICGAVCVYILIGFCFAMLHIMIILANPKAYKDTLITNQSAISPNELRARSRYPIFVYFSFCTLTTVGYGDIIPVSRLARSLSWVEAVTGQLYLAILVARLVGLHIVGGRSETTSGSRNISSDREFENSVP